MPANFEIELNKKEITHPLVKVLIVATALLFVGVLIAILTFLILPMIGAAVAFSIALGLVILLALATGHLAFSIKKD